MVGNELEKRGCHVIHGDRELAYCGDPETGEPVTPNTEKPSAKWRSAHHIWDLEKVQRHIDSDAEDCTFFCGGSRNFSKFVDLLDGVFILDVDCETMMARIDKRISVDPSDFGATEEERSLILELHETKRDIPKIGTIIDAAQQSDKVVDQILDIIKVMEGDGAGPQRPDR